MDYNLVINIETCSAIVDQLMNGNVNLVYYAHIPSIVISLLIGSFVLLKSRNSLSAKLLFSICIIFSMWTVLNLISWISSNSEAIMFSWSLLGILSILFYLLCLYFVYVFIDKRDISLSMKIFFGLLILPVIILTPTTLNLSGFDYNNCMAIDRLFDNYIYFPQVVASLWIIILAILRYRKADSDFRKQIALLTVGISLFLLTFFGSGYLADKYGIYSIELLGLLAMVIFLGFLAYLIVRFKAFNIKFIGAQALVLTMIILIGSQFFFIQTNINRVLTGITLILVTGFGWFLIKSVKDEIKRKEELQIISSELAQSNDKLRKLDNAKSEFISIASHQLRTPLTAMKGFLSLLIEGSYGKLSERQVETLGKVYISNERLISLVEDLLNISRIESGRMEFKFSNTQLVNICNELVDTFNMRAKNAGLYLELKMPSDPISEVFVDGSKIREVISNLIDNAIKYTPKGGITIRIENIISPTRVENINGKGSVRVTVADTGVGISTADLSRLFSKFSRGIDTPRINTSGTGLGLYVGKSMTEANGGRIWAESDGEGKGSRFIMEIPIEQSKENSKRWN